jgi:hypothetical protein
LEIKNIILEVKFSNKGFHGFETSGLDILKPCGIPRKRTWKFPGICYFPDLRQTSGAENIPKTVLKTRLKTKETTYTLVFGKNLVVSAFERSIEDYLSGT